MNRLLHLIAVAALAAAAPVYAAAAAEPSTTQVVALRAKLDALFDAPDYATSRWGVVVQDLDSSTTLYERDAGKAFMPASNLKLYSTAASTAILGPQFTFSTVLGTTGTISTDGTLHGNLVVVGSGDPSISGRYARRWLQPGTAEPDEDSTTETPTVKSDTTAAILDRWAAAIKAAGVKKVDGSVIALDPLFSGENRAGSWQLDYYGDWYAAESSGLAINENCWDATVTPGTEPGAPAKIESPLPTSYVTFQNDVRTIAAGKNARTAISFDRDLNANTIRISGTIPVGAAPNKIWGSVHDGNLYSATLVSEALQRQGIEVSASPIAVRTSVPESLTILHRHTSPDLARIITIVNKPSQNFYADQLLRTLGALQRKRGSFEVGESVVRDYLTTAGAPKSDVAALRMRDGSGLSRQNAVTPRMTIALLRDMQSRPSFEAFLRSLPVSGRDGTIRDRLRGSVLDGHVHAKTGTINSVRCLSGYILPSGGRRLAFSLMANNYPVPTSKVNETIDQVLLLCISAHEL